MKLQFLLLLAALHAPFADAGQALPLNTQALEASVLKLMRSGTNKRDERLVSSTWNGGTTAPEGFEHMGQGACAASTNGARTCVLMKNGSPYPTQGGCYEYCRDNSKCTGFSSRAAEGSSSGSTCYIYALCADRNYPGESGARGPHDGTCSGSTRDNPNFVGYTDCGLAEGTSDTIGGAFAISSVQQQQCMKKSTTTTAVTNTNTTSAIVSMKNLVAEFLMPHLDGMHKDDEDAMRLADGATTWSGFDSCESDHKKYNVSISAFSEAHKTCRANESQFKGAMDSACGDERDRKTQRYIAECAVFAVRRPIPAELPTTCYKNRGTTNQHESGRLAEYFKGLRDDYIEWQTKCEEATNASRAQNRTCEDDTIKYVNKSAECDKAQIELDSAACWQYRQGDCQAYSRCWAQATTNYNDLNSSVAAAVTARKSESAGLQKILCYLDVLNASQQVSTGQQENITTGLQGCDQLDYDTSAFDLQYLYYADRAPTLPSMPSCAGSEVYPQPGTAAYVAQEYDPLPEDAPARECQSLCCQWCNYYECPNNLHFQNASCVKAYTMGECCDVVAWRPTPWVNPVCNSSCGQAAQNATRTVPCQDPEGTSFPDADCANYTKPAATQALCSATSECAVCAAGACNVTGTYLNDCGGFSNGSCKECNVTTGSYAIGIGGVNQDTCPSSLCSLRAVCPAGQYLDGCGGANSGSCKNCTDQCLHGFYSDGCTGMSAGTCSACDVPSGYLAITAGSSSSDRCDTVAETEATAVTTNFTLTDLAGWTLDKDSNRHSATISGQQLNFVKLTELCKRSDVTPGFMKYTMMTNTGKNYKVAVEAAWWPVFGDGLKGSNMCHGNGTSVLQFQATGTGSDDPVGANVTSCFDQVTYFNWSTVWFEFAPSTALVELTLKESKFSCLAVKSVKIYEVDG